MSQSIHSPIRVLVADDETPYLNLLKQGLSDVGYDVSTAQNAQDVLRMAQETQFDVIIADIHLGRANAVDALAELPRRGELPALIYMTGQAELDTAVKAMQGGAYEYVVKGMSFLETIEELKSLIERATSEEKVTFVKLPALKSTAKLVSRSPEMGKVLRVAAKAALSQSNVLITGESGSGKEVIANLIHQNSSRSSKPFITVNCGALTETLLESELFGHVKGAFTGAFCTRRGLFEEADGGTLFLDEIGDISLNMQVKLLRVIQEGEFRPVGSTEVHRTDVRLIAATHRDLIAEMQAGKFREDLYYRLKVIRIDIPALRDRKQDIPSLIQYFIERHCERLDKQPVKLAEEALDLLCRYSWPGNVRELENATERAVVMSNGPMLYADDFREEVLISDRPREQGAQVEEAAPVYSLDELEKKHILKTLRDVRYNKSKAAQLLGIDRVTLYRKIMRFGISNETPLPPTASAV